MNEEALLFSAGCDKGVVAHCKKVAEIASRYQGESIASHLVYSGAMLHDLGRSKTHSAHHARIGAELSSKMNLSREITSIIRTHIGAGLSEDDCILLNIPPEDCVPKSLEEKIVAHADNLAKGSREIRKEERMILIAGQSHRSKKNVWRMALEMDLLER
ncbi:MAG TPA: HDIG domain-containing protein [Methanocorpusculum sp.]|nr:HDIG domain-containing protein [Methanocorpusculum sp.]